MPAKIRVLLVEADPDWIEGLKSVVGITEDIILIGCMQSKQAADLLMEYLEVDVVLLDIMLDNRTDWFSLMNEISAKKPGIKIIILSSAEDGKTVWEAFTSGAFNYIVKSSDYNEIPQAIREAYRNESSIHSSSAAVVRNEFLRIKQEQLQTLLTPAEKILLSHVYSGKSTTEIRQILFIEEHSINNHISNINKKLHTRNRKEAALLANSKGLLEDKL